VAQSDGRDDREEGADDREAAVDGLELARVQQEGHEESEKRFHSPMWRHEDCATK
jgi:hypothetical protein